MVGMTIAVHRAATAALVSLALAGLACTAARSPAATAAAASQARTTPDRTTPAQARLVDRVPAPVLHWRTCRKTAQCSTARLPLDYRHPDGAKILLALLRIPARDPRHRLGTLFVNPGGPGDSARDFAFSATVPPAVPRKILDRFDIVGIDPRGVGGSTPIRCFTSQAQRARVEGPLTATPFPVTAAAQRTWIGAARALGRACSTTARPIASAMSTTEDARDMDVLRRALGDRKLTFLGVSYGSYLGLVYASMFPDRVRAMVLDGIVNPRAWAGTPATAGVPQLDRLGAAAASDRVLSKLLALCQQAGRPRCAFAGPHGSPVAVTRFARLAARLRAHPQRLAAPGIRAVTFTYQNLISDTGQWLRAPAGFRGLFPELAGLARLTAPGGGGPGRAAVVRQVLRLHAALQPGKVPFDHLAASSGVLCTDGFHAADAAGWPAAAAAASRKARYFGAAYAWDTAQCATSTWTAQDPSVYRGPFSPRTSAPVLLIGARWDPATSFASAVETARMLPGSRLVASDSWGHTALLTSACVDNTVWDYLLRPLAPAPKVTRCRGDVQPFAPGPATG
jgi:pimeloyl-ACP methyl ester carboxylesterase